MRRELRNLGFAPKGEALDFQERVRDIFVLIFFATFFHQGKKVGHKSKKALFEA